MKDAKSASPVFLLDEIDKVSRGHGDPLSALLEILDPEQNTHFVDRYLEFPIDLSKALYICTSNDADLLPDPLKDRMDLVHFREYSEDERRIITYNYLIPKILKDYKLETYPIVLEDAVVERLIKLKQLRQIEKKLRRLYRMAAVQVYIAKKDTQTISLAFASAILQTQEKEAIGFGR